MTGRFYAIVPAGGSGTRLWPLSRAARPKFLLPLPGPRSMIQETIARLTPHRFHQYVNRLRGRAEVDTFPTRYQANSVSDVTRIATDAGLLVERVDLIEGRPEYLRMTWPTYLVGLAYERLVNSAALFAPLRILLVGTLRKPIIGTPGCP